MKYLLLLVCFLLSAAFAFAQNDTIYYYRFLRVERTDSFTHYRVIPPISEDKRYHVREYDRSNKLCRMLTYKNFSLEHCGDKILATLDGKYMEYDSTGNICIEGFIVNDKYEGKWTEYYKGSTQIRYAGEMKNDKRNGVFYNYYPSGKIKRREQYKDGFFVRGKKYNENGKKIRYTRYIREPDSRINIHKWLHYNLRYPKYEKENKIEGRVVITFTVDKQGYVKDVKAWKSPTEGLANEAIRVIKALPRWKPFIKDDEPQQIYFTQSIKFLL